MLFLKGCWGRMSRQLIGTHSLNLPMVSVFNSIFFLFCLNCSSFLRLLGYYSIRYCCCVHNGTPGVLKYSCSFRNVSFATREWLNQNSLRKAERRKQGTVSHICRDEAKLIRTRKASIIELLPRDKHCVCLHVFYLIWPSQEWFEVGNAVIPILLMRKLRLGEITEAGKWWI